MSFSDVGTEWYSRCGRIGRLHVVMSQLLGGKSKPEGFPTFLPFFFLMLRFCKKQRSFLFLAPWHGHIWLGFRPKSIINGRDDLIKQPRGEANKKASPLPVSYKAFADLYRLIGLFLSTGKLLPFSPKSLFLFFSRFRYGLDLKFFWVIFDGRFFFLMVKLPTLSAPSLLGSECHLIQSRSSDGRSLWRRRDAVVAPTSECHRAKASMTLTSPTILEVVPGHFYASLWTMRLLLDPWLCQMHLLARK